MLRLRRSALLVLTALLAWASGARAETVNVHLLIGLSNSIGVIGSYEPVPADSAIRLYPELATLDVDAFDFTKNEYPAGAPTAAPRWVQTVPPRRQQLRPVTFGGEVRRGAEIAFGRLLYTQLKNSGAAGSIAIAKFSVGGTSLERYWVRSRSVDLVDRMVMALYAIDSEIRTGGDVPVWRSLTTLMGESDTSNMNDARALAGNLGLIIGKVRAFTGNPVLPVIVVKTSVELDMLNPPDAERRRQPLAAVRAGEEEACRSLSKCKLVVVDDLVHFNAYHFREDQYAILGRRLYAAWAALR